MPVGLVCVQIVPLTKIVAERGAVRVAVRVAVRLRVVCHGVKHYKPNRLPKGDYNYN